MNETPTALKPSWRNPDTHGSLADVEPGQTVRIRRILFALLRDLCRDAGVHDGDELRCSAAEPARIVLRNNHDRTIVCRREWARFVEIDVA